MSNAGQTAGGVEVEQSDLIREDTIELLHVNQTCVMSTIMPDGSPHASAAHFALNQKNQSLYISLDDRSQTAQNLVTDSRTAVTVGTDPAMPATLQMRGHTIVIQYPELAEVCDVFYERFPHSARYRDDPHTVLVQFRPTWARYSDAKSRKSFFVRGFASEMLR